MDNINQESSLVEQAEVNKADVVLAEVQALDVQGKFVVIKSDNINAAQLSAIRDGLTGKGALGIIGLSSDSDISTLSREQVQALVGSGSGETEVETLEAMERRALVNALAATNGNKTKVAELLGVTVKTVYNKLHQYGLFERTRGN